MDKNDIRIQVSNIIRDVQSKGDEALEDYTSRYDDVKIKVSASCILPEQMQKAYDSVSETFRDSILFSKRRIQKFYQMESQRILKNWNKNVDGVVVGQRSYPVEKIGIYVPGGQYSYPSVVLMTAVPARVAGVSSIIIMTPYKKLSQEVLSAAWIAKVDMIFPIGGPWAIAALAYGTKTIPKVDKIIGPGNVYVTEAKRQVYGAAGIDNLSGPSEVVVVADKYSSVDKIVMNLLAQSEHDADAKAFLFSCDTYILDAVKVQIPSKFINQISFEFYSTFQKIIDKVNILAPEHLFLCFKKAKSWLKKFKYAGAIFIGEDTPVALGDYSAGPSHVLPTNRAGRFSSGLSIRDFMVWTSTIQTVSRKKANPCFQSAQKIASSEGLLYHEKSLL